MRKEKNVSFVDIRYLNNNNTNHNQYNTIQHDNMCNNPRKINVIQNKNKLTTKTYTYKTNIKHDMKK